MEVNLLWNVIFKKLNFLSMIEGIATIIAIYLICATWFAIIRGFKRKKGNEYTH